MRSTEWASTARRSEIIKPEFVAVAACRFHATSSHDDAHGTQVDDRLGGQPLVRHRRGRDALE